MLYTRTDYVRLTRFPYPMVMFCATLLPCGCAGKQANESIKASAPNQVSYVVSIVDRPAGELTIHSEPDGIRTSRYWFHDRGRGPQLESEAVVHNRESGQLVVTRLSIRGHGYWKDRVDESFSCDNATCRWKNLIEEDTSDSAGKAFYVPLDGTPAETALLAQVLLSTPERSRSVLPRGSARIAEVTKATVEAQGSRRQVTLYAITGLDFTPSFLWLDDRRELFAAGSGWLRVIRKGWESAADTLDPLQRRAASQMLEEISRRVGQRPVGPLVIRNVALFDAEAATTVPGMTVVISGDRITQVGTVDSIAIPAGAQTIDGSGHTLMPGLWDMHVHLRPEAGIMHIAGGVTSVRDLANDIDILLGLKKQFDSNEIAGPRVIMAGIIDGTSEYTGPTKMVVDTEEQARAAITRYKELGFEQIKLYSSIKPELVAPIAEFAHSLGLRVSGHIPAFMTAEQAIEQGYDEIQHANMLILNFLFDRVKDTRTRRRHTAVGEFAADLDLNSERVAAFIRLIVERNVVIDPTLTIFEQHFQGQPGQTAPGFVPVQDAFPVQLGRAMRKRGLPVNDETRPRYRAAFDVMLALIGKLYRAGAHIVAGTDDLPGFALHRELELYVAAGIPAGQVLQLATLGSARLTRRDAELGTIEPGKLADMVLVKGDPAARIRDIRNTTLTIKGGVLYPAARLYREIGIDHRLGGSVSLGAQSAQDRGHEAGNLRL